MDLWHPVLRYATVVVLLCGSVSPSESQLSGPVAQHDQDSPEDCGWIGVHVRPITKAFAESLGMVELYGAIFDQPEPGSPADEAGIEEGDVITTVNGRPIRKATDFDSIISRRPPGTFVNLTTYRNGQLIERTVMLSACPGTDREGWTGRKE